MVKWNYRSSQGRRASEGDPEAAHDRVRHLAPEYAGRDRDQAEDAGGDRPRLDVSRTWSFSPALISYGSASLRECASALQLRPRLRCGR